MSGFFFYIQIQDLDEILRQEIARGKPNSFILEFLPYDESKVVESRTVINIIKSQLSTFFFKKNDIYFMPSLRGLQLRAGTMPALQRLIRRAADAGGSKRFNNKSRKNKYKHKYNYKYKKSRKNKRHRRKRTQSTQNKMF
jgi:Zn-finger nucleic acid-binding protein